MRVTIWRRFRGARFRWEKYDYNKTRFISFAFADPHKATWWSILVTIYY